MAGQSITPDRRALLAAAVTAPLAGASIAHACSGDRSALDVAIARHRAAQAEIDAFPKARNLEEEQAHEPAFNVLLDKETEALRALAHTHCADDAILLAKLRYMLEVEIRNWGEPYMELSFGPVSVALAEHFKLTEAA